MHRSRIGTINGNGIYSGHPPEAVPPKNSSAQEYPRHRRNRVTSTSITRPYSLTISTHRIWTPRRKLPTILGCRPASAPTLSSLVLSSTKRETAFIAAAFDTQPASKSGAQIAITFQGADRQTAGRALTSGKARAHRNPSPLALALRIRYDLEGKECGASAGMSGYAFRVLRLRRPLYVNGGTGKSIAEVRRATGYAQRQTGQAQRFCCPYQPKAGTDLPTELAL